MIRRIRICLTSAALLAAIALSPVAWAQEPPLPGPTEAAIRSLTVTGDGVIRAKPDMAVVTLGVVNQADEAQAALRANTEAMTRILDALRAEGIESRDLQTSGFSVEPRYSQPPVDPQLNQIWEPEITGYTVRNNVTIRIRDLAETGAILDRVVTLGANSISGPTFTVAEPERLEDSARAAAVRDARRKAELYAGAADVTLGPVVRLQEQGFFQPEPMMMRQSMNAEAADMAAPVPIEGGEVTVQAQVSVTWGLE